MTPLHLHLALGHVPPVGVAFGLALLAYGRIRRSEEVALAALVTFVVVGTVSAAAYLSGGGAEEAVGRLAGIGAGRVEAHGEMALLATLAAAGLGMLALAELVLLRMGATPNAFKVLTFGAALAVAALAGWTSWLGQSIRHGELETGAPVIPSGAARSMESIAPPPSAAAPEGSLNTPSPRRDP